MLTELKTLIDNLNTGYQVIYENNNMANLIADTKKHNTKIALIEEFTNGYYSFSGDNDKEVLNIEIYMFQFCDPQNKAIDRQNIRNQINTEIVRPIVNAVRNSTENIFLLEDTQISFTYPLCKYDANEVGIALNFTIYQRLC